MHRSPPPPRLITLLWMNEPETGTVQLLRGAGKVTSMQNEKNNNKEERGSAK